MRRLLAQLLVLISLITITPGWCGALEVTLQRIDANGTGETIGSITAQDTDQGLVIYPDLSGLTPGEHGFHLHSVGSCDASETENGTAVAGLAAGGHWDPDGSGQHLGPFGNGHRGDLSKLIVDDDGNTNTSVVAPRLSTADLRGKALIVHAGGDTYRDQPTLGGGGARVACGVVQDDR
jgi:Cu-Zn family superoxide dismutase